MTKKKDLIRYNNNIAPDFAQIRNNHMEVFKEFDNMAGKMMKHVDDMFGSFGNFGSIHKELNIFKDFNDFGSFSSIDDQLTRGKGASKVVQRSYVIETKLDQNGRKFQEKYMDNNFAMRGNDGNTVSERHQAYHNSGNNHQRMAQERKFNDQGHKVVHERFGHTGEVRENRYYKNIGQDEEDQFHDRWNSYAEKHGFYDAFGKKLGYDYNTKGSYQEPHIKQNKWGSNLREDLPALMHGRKKQNELMPTVPGRLALPSSNNEPRYDIRNEPERNEEVYTNNDAVRNIVPRGYAPRPRPAPTRNEGNVNVPDKQGNFAMRNPNNHAMPRAG